MREMVRYQVNVKSWRYRKDAAAPRYDERRGDERIEMDEGLWAGDFAVWLALPPSNRRLGTGLIDLPRREWTFWNSFGLRWTS